MSSAIAKRSASDAALPRYDDMCRAIAECYRVDEAKGIRDKTLALEQYFKQAKNTENERRCCEVRLRAERKAGEIRRAEAKAKGFNAASPPPAGGRTQTNAERRKELGISKKQDEQWQALASVPEKDFEAALAAPSKPSTSSIVGKVAKKAQMDPKALWLWGRLRDFEREGLLDADARKLLAAMTDAMRADVRRLATRVAEWLGDIT